MQKIKLLLLSVLFLLTVAIGQAMAALPAGVALAFTELQTDFDSIMALAWPVATAIMIGFAILALVKKVWGKTAGR